MLASGIHRHRGYAGIGDIRHRGYAGIGDMLASGICWHRGYGSRDTLASGIFWHRGYAGIGDMLASGKCWHRGREFGSMLIYIVIINAKSCINASELIGINCAVCINVN